MARVPIAGPWITAREVEAVADAAAHDWYEGAGQINRRFEEAFARHLGVRHAVSLPHCTAAIHLSLLALGVGPGDEVVVPDLTWIASAAPIAYVGATPVFADVDPETWCLSPDAFAAAITDRTAAVIPVDLYGGMPDYPAIAAVAEQHDIAVIEDAAEAAGSKRDGRPAGSFGDTGVFSFHGSKTLTTGEGGLLATDRTDLYERVLFLRDHGRAPGDQHFQNAEVAYKYKMSGLQAALGTVQLERIEELVGKKRQIFTWYRDALEGTPGLTLNAEPPGTRNSYWMTTAVLDPELGIESFDLMEQLEKQGIATRPFFRPLSSLPAYADALSTRGARERNPVSYRIGPHGINLPSALRLEAADVDRVCRALREALA